MAAPCYLGWDFSTQQVPGPPPPPLLSPPLPRRAAGPGARRGGPGACPARGSSGAASAAASGSCKGARPGLARPPWRPPDLPMPGTGLPPPGSFHRPCPPPGEGLRAFPIYSRAGRRGLTHASGPPHLVQNIPLRFVCPKASVGHGRSACPAARLPPSLPLRKRVLRPLLFAPSLVRSCSCVSCRVLLPRPARDAFNPGTGCCGPSPRVGCVDTPLPAASGRPGAGICT